MRRFGTVTLMLFALNFVIAPGCSDVSGKYDPTTYLYARDNVSQLRSYMAAYAADSDAGLYPIGSHDYEGIKQILPDVAFPDNPGRAGWLPGSFYFESESGRSYTITVSVNDGEKATITGTPEGIMEEYQHPMAGGQKKSKKLAIIKTRIH